MKEWVLYIMATAARLSGYPVPDALPEVQFEPESWFSHRVCRDHIPCPVYGLYEDHDVVYIRSDLTDSRLRVRAYFLNAARVCSLNARRPADSRSTAPRKPGPSCLALRYTPQGREFISKLKVGDEVEVTYTEAVAISVGPSS